MNDANSFANHAEMVIKQFRDGAIMGCEMVNNIGARIFECSDTNWYQEEQKILDELINQE